MALILKRPWTSQPQVAVPLNPAYGLRALLLPSLGWDVARVAAPFAVTGTPSRAPVGRGIAYVTSDGSLIDALNNSSTSTSGATVVISGRYVGAAPSANSYGQFGAQAVASAERFGAHIPFTDGTVYFDFGGSTTGTNRVIAAGLTFSQADTWVFSTGPAGMQIWQNGILRASNTANPSRTNAGGGNFGLRGNSSGGTSGDSGQWALFGYAPVQWSKDQNAAISANPWQLFAPLPRRIWVPAGSSAPVSALAATGESATFSATASGGTLAALAATGSTGVFSGAANSVSSGSLAATGSTGAFSAAANSTTSVVLAATGESGAFVGSAGAGASAALAAAGATGVFSGNASVPATVSMGVTGGTGNFSGSSSSGSISAPAYSANRLSGVKLPAATQSAYDIALQRALVPALNSIIIKLNQLGDGLAIGQNNLRTAPPLGGSWQAGDEVRNSAPAELGAIGSKYVIRGWQCIASGTPGTWVQQRTLTGN